MSLSNKTIKVYSDDESKENDQSDKINDSEAEGNEEQSEEEENEEDEDEFGEPDSKKSKFDMGSDLDDEGKGIFC